jgi:ribosomal protein S15P/S13E
MTLFLNTHIKGHKKDFNPLIYLQKWRGKIRDIIFIKDKDIEYVGNKRYFEALVIFSNY